MYRDGYLVIYFEPQGAPQLVFAVLSEGRLKYYSEKGGTYLGEWVLTRKRLQLMRLDVAQDKLPHRFLLRLESRRPRSSRSIFPLHFDTFKYMLQDISEEDHPIEVEICAADATGYQHWANAIGLWYRQSFRINNLTKTSSSNCASPEALALVQEQDRALLRLYIQAIGKPTHQRAMCKI